MTDPRSGGTPAAAPDRLAEVERLAALLYEQLPWDRFPMGARDLVMQDAVRLYGHGLRVLPVAPAPSEAAPPSGPWKVEHLEGREGTFRDPWRVVLHDPEGLRGELVGYDFPGEPEAVAVRDALNRVAGGAESPDTEKP